MAVHPLTDVMPGLPAATGLSNTGDAAGNLGPFQNAGAPTSGVSGTKFGVAAPGALLVDTTNTKLYINTNTLASPTWTVVGTQT